MPTLILTQQPGMTDIPDTAFDAAQPATAADLKALNANAKFAAVRNEQFWGFYKNGETVALPVSPADGYEYAREELRYTADIYSTCAAPSALNGTQTPPAMGGTSAAGQLLKFLMFLDQATGLVTTQVNYYATGQAETATSDGILMVTTHAQRAR